MRHGFSKVPSTSIPLAAFSHLLVGVLYAPALRLSLHLFLGRVSSPNEQVDRCWSTIRWHSFHEPHLLCRHRLRAASAGRPVCTVGLAAAVQPHPSRSQAM